MNHEPAADGSTRSSGAECVIAARRGHCVLERWCGEHGVPSGVAGDCAAGWRSNRYRRGDVLFYQGNEPFALYFLCQGRVKLVHEDHEGRRQVIRVVRAPSFVGERPLIARQQYHSTAEVVDDSVICMINSARFSALLDEHSEFSRAIMRSLASILGDAQLSAIDHLLRPVRVRLAHLLALEWVMAGKPSGTFLLHESRQELAELIGTWPEVISRNLWCLAEDEILSIKGRRVQVLDPKRLCAVAGLPGDAAGTA